MPQLFRPKEEHGGTTCPVPSGKGHASASSCPNPNPPLISGTQSRAVTEDCRPYSPELSLIQPNTSQHKLQATDMYCVPGMKTDGTAKNTMTMMSKPDSERRQQLFAGPSSNQIPDFLPLVPWFSHLKGEATAYYLKPQ